MKNQETSIYVFTGDYNVSIATLKKVTRILGGELEEVVKISHPPKRITPRQIEKAVKKCFGEGHSAKRRWPQKRGMISPPPRPKN